MGWTGAIAIFLHLFFGSIDAVKKINSILKWIALVVGLFQAATLALIVLAGATGYPPRSAAALLFFAGMNVYAWAVIRASEPTKEIP